MKRTCDRCGKEIDGDECRDMNTGYVLCRECMSVEYPSWASVFKIVSGWDK